MEKIRKYVERFNRTTNTNLSHKICTGEIDAFKHAIDASPFENLVLLFDYGFAKGYRAAIADQKKQTKNKEKKSA